MPRLLASRGAYRLGRNWAGIEACPEGEFAESQTCKHCTRVQLEPVSLLFIRRGSAFAPTTSKAGYGRLTQLKESWAGQFLGLLSPRSIKDVITGAGARACIVESSKPVLGVTDERKISQQNVADMGQEQRGGAPWYTQEPETLAAGKVCWSHSIICVRDVLWPESSRIDFHCHQTLKSDASLRSRFTSLQAR